MGKRLAGVLLGVVAILGMKFYGKASAHDDVKARLVSLCEADAECLADVEKHFDACFDASYKMGGRRSSSKLDAQALVKCVNSRSGVPYFEVNDEETK
jgi:hypothetical protein